MERLSFRLLGDSMYYMPAGLDSVYAEVLPDTSFTAFEELISRLIKDSSIRSHKGSNCHDCGHMALEIWTARDTVTYFQSGMISPVIDSLIELVRKVASRPRKKVAGQIVFQTEGRVTPPPPHVEPPPHKD